MSFDVVKWSIKLIIVTIIITKIWALSLYLIFANNSDVTSKIENDSFHHYQVGILLVMLGFISKRKLKAFHVLFCVGMGISLEEWPIVLSDLGLNTKHLYHSGFDMLLILGILVVAYIYIARTQVTNKS